MHSIGFGVRAARRGAHSAMGALLAAAAILVWQPGVVAAADSAQDAQAASDNGHIYAMPAQGNVWIMGGEPDESNVAVQVGGEGVLVVDTGVTPMAAQLLAQIRKLAAEKAGDQKAIRIVVDTDGLPDHIGGNEVIRKGGSSIVAGNFAFDNPGLENGASVMASQSLLMRLVAESAKGAAGAGQALWPNNTEDFDLYNMHFNGEAVQLYHPHQATTDGNLMVMFRRSDVIASGDTVMMTGYPIIDVDRGGSIDGELVALNKIIEMAVPVDKQEGGTMIIPGHGRLCDQSDVVHYKNVITILRDRIQYYKNQGKSLQQVLALKPTWDYDQRWGAGSGPWTTQQFVEAVYRTLPAKGPSFSMQTETVVPATASVSGGKVY
ncbi:MAG TPA: MBL fold metallo-hydrolase [Steroidobacteraceae bacterium]|jgi:glyoxylase-like metal-dependent hydrolase (beta-lactamase superfamily II)|nr:MBL fold metallo-hydrolase [Steroidobacteraceae bacterium]